MALIPANITARAATATGDSGAATTVQSTCVISAAGLIFGAYKGKRTDAAALLSITCTKSTLYTVGLDAGTAAGATVTSRKTTGPASATLRYSLHTDAVRTINWGDSDGIDTVAGTGDGNAHALTIYGRMPGGQAVAPGAFSDTITAIVTY